MKFTDRKHAGQKLAERLVEYFNQLGIKVSDDMVVVGLPRGGVPVAFEVAKTLNCVLEILVSKKLPYPGQPEYAIGAVSSDGIAIFNPRIPKTDDWTRYVEDERKRLLNLTAEIEYRFYREAGLDRPLNFKDKVVIVVDDGIATGMTAIAALETCRARGARLLIVATPVMGQDSYTELEPHADAIVAVAVPEIFQSVGQHYENFRQTTDAEVVEALKASTQFGRNDLTPRMRLGA